MTTMKHWTVRIVIDEHEGISTRAEALLAAGDNQLTGVGVARLNPADRDIPAIGDELAVARALSELSHQLLNTAAQDIEGVTAKPAHIEA